MSCVDYFTFGNMEGILPFFIFRSRITIFNLLKFNLLICTPATPRSGKICSTDPATISKTIVLLI